MEIRVIEKVLTVSLELIPSMGLAALVLFLGYFVRRHWRLLDRLNIPAPVIGGLIFATAALLLRTTGTLAFRLDLVLQTPLMIAFFTTIGLTASLSLVKVGGVQVLVFWTLASSLAILQNAMGAFLAKILGVHPFLGLVAGSVTMTGGHGTGLAFGPLLEQLGLKGATTLAVAAATFGLVSGGLIGGPVGTFLINRKKLCLSPRKTTASKAPPTESIDQFAEADEPKLELNAYEILKYIALILTCMWAGLLISRGIERLGLTLPVYIGSMLTAAFLRNFLDLTGMIKITQGYVELLGSVALNLFLSMALMSLRLWELLELAIPLTAILLAQVAMIAFFALFITYRFMGRDYDAAVMAAGHCGFGLGATPNAIANMSSLVEKFGPAPRAFLVVPLVGAFLIDFTNALIITLFINLLK